MPAAQLAQYASAVGVQPTRRVPGAQTSVELHGVQSPFMTRATPCVDQVEPATQAAQEVSAVVLHTVRVPAAHVLAEQLEQAHELADVEKFAPATHGTQAAFALAVQLRRYVPAAQVVESQAWQAAADGGMTSALAAEDHVEPAAHAAQPTSAVSVHSVGTEPAEHGLVEAQDVQPAVLLPVPLTEKEPLAQSVQYESAPAVQATPYWPGVVQFSSVHAGQVGSSVPGTEKVPAAQLAHAALAVLLHTRLKVPWVPTHVKVDGSVQVLHELVRALEASDQDPTAQALQLVSTDAVHATVYWPATQLDDEQEGQLALWVPVSVHVVGEHATQS